MHNRLTDDQVLEATNVFNKLSPENLTCDGELSRAQVAKRFRELTARLRVIESAVGFKLDEMAVYTEFKNRRLQYPDFREMIKRGWV